MSWNHFLFWSGFTNEQDDQVKKSLIDKQFGFVKRFKKEMVEDLMQDNTQENSSCQGFKESIDEDGREALDDGQDHVVEDEKMEKTFELDSEEDICSTEQNQSSMCIQECSTKAYVVANSKGDILQIPNEKMQNKSFMQVEGQKWRPKTRPTNKLRLNMKRISNPKLGK